MPYDTESKSRNVLASPLGEEGHEVAKGCTRVRMIMILLFYVLSPFAQGAADWRSGPRWTILSVLCPVHTFPLRGTSPQGETRDMREKQRVIYFTYHFGVFPLWWLAPPPFPRKRGHYGCLVMWPCFCRKAWKPILPPEQGEVRRSRIGGGERSEPISRMLIKPYDTVR